MKHVIALLSCCVAGLAIFIIVLVAAPNTFAVDDSQSRPYSYNEMRRYENGHVIAEFHSKFINYVDELGRWQPINLTPEQDIDGFHITKAPYELHLPLRSTDE